MNILDAMDDPKVFGQHFQDRETWHAWAAFLAVLFGLPLDASMKGTFRECTTRSAPLLGGQPSSSAVGVQASHSCSPPLPCS